MNSAVTEPISSSVLACASDRLFAGLDTSAAFTGQPARPWEPKRLRLRLLAVSGRIVRSGRRRHQRYPPTPTEAQEHGRPQRRNPMLPNGDHSPDTQLSHHRPATRKIEANRR